MFNKKTILITAVIGASISLSGCDLGESKQNYSMKEVGNTVVVLNNNTGKAKILREGYLEDLEKEPVNKKFKETSTTIANGNVKIVANAKVVDGEVYAKYVITEEMKPGEKFREIDWIRNQVDSSAQVTIDFSDSDGYVLKKVNIPVKSSTRNLGYGQLIKSSLENVVIESYVSSRAKDFEKISITWNFNLNVPPRQKLNK
ncbi:TPA: hypothetical protein P0E36_004931 [Vibrio harveyi]|nr:hypothetical protein [Vibrio harveyi]